MSDALVMQFGAAVEPADVGFEALASSLHDATRQKALDAFRSQHSASFGPLELETRLWDLVARIADADTFSTSLVIEWLQENLPKVPEPAHLQGIKWMYTRNRSSGGGPQAVVSELDSDAPLRQALPIAGEDAEADEVLFKYVFDLILSGEIKRAQAACANTNNWLLRAAVSVDTQPTPSFLDACERLSSDRQIGQWEAAVYGLLCGNLAVVTPFCDSWEKLLLAHLLAHAPLSEFLAVVRTNADISAQNADPIRRIALAVVEQRVEQLVAQYVTTGLDELTGTPSLARILLHLQLVLSGKCDAVLTRVYIEYICSDEAQLAQRLELVPAYVRFLPASDMPSVYGFVLAQITDAETQETQLRLARRYGIAMAPVLEQAVSLNFELAVREGAVEGVADSDAAVRESDARLVAILNWLVLAELWPQAVAALVQTYVFFLAKSRRHGAVLLADRVSAESVRARTFESLGASLPGKVVVELNLLHECAQLALALGYLDAWRAADKTLTSVVAETIEAVTAALAFGVAAPEMPEIAAIRREYVPLITYELLDLLARASTASAAKEALKFAVMIADDELKLYELFDKRLLAAFALPALSV